MISEHDIEAFRDHDEALDRAGERLKRGVAEHRHIMPDEQIKLIRAGLFYRAWCKVLGMELLARQEAERQRGLEAMEASKDPNRG